MNIEQQEQILSRITTRDEAGKHFTENYNAGDLAELEAEGLITFTTPFTKQPGYPTHRNTGAWKSPMPGWR